MLMLSSLLRSPRLIFMVDSTAPCFSRTVPLPFTVSSVYGPSYGLSHALVIVTATAGTSCREQSSCLVFVAATAGIGRREHSLCPRRQSGHRRRYQLQGAFVIPKSSSRPLQGPVAGRKDSISFGRHLLDTVIPMSSYRDAHSFRRKFVIATLAIIVAAGAVVLSRTVRTAGAPNAASGTIPILGIPAITSPSESGQASPSGTTPGGFDNYVFAFRYMPEFCHSTNIKEEPGCGEPLVEWQDIRMHGLWPEYSDGTWPCNCANEPLDKSVVKKIGYLRFKTIWPDQENDSGLTVPTGSYWLWSHEWSKHGTCTNLTEEDYFEAAFSAFDRLYSDFIRLNYGKKVSKQQLQESFGGDGMVQLQCAGGKYLKGLQLLLGKDLYGFPTNMIPFPPAMNQTYNLCGDEIILQVFQYEPMN